MGDGSVTAERVRDALGLVPEDEFIAILDLIAERRAADVFPTVARLAEAGIDFGGLLTGLADMLRAQLVVVLGGTAPEVSERAREALDAASRAHRRRGSAAHAAGDRRARAALPKERPAAVAGRDAARSLRAARSRGRARGRPAVARRRSGGDRRRRRGAIRRGGGGGSGRAAAEALLPLSPVRSRDHAARAESSGQSRGVRRPLAARQPAAAAAPSADRRRYARRRARSIVEQADSDVGRARRAHARAAASRCSRPRSSTRRRSPSTASGVVTIELDEPNDIYAHAIDERARARSLAMLREWFAGVERVELRRDEQAPQRAAEAPDRRDGARRANRRAEEARSGAERGDRRARSRSRRLTLSLSLATASFERQHQQPATPVASSQMPDFMKILQQAQEMQGRFQKIQDELQQQTVTGSAGGGMVDGRGLAAPVRSRRSSSTRAS